MILQPLLQAAVFTIVFGKFGHLPAGGVPYSVLTFTALVPWLLFVNALTSSTRSFVDNQPLVTKVYIPRIFIPIAPVLSGMVDFTIGLAVLAGLLAWYGIVPPLHVVPPSVLHPLRDRHVDRRHAVALGPERALPRRAVHAPVPVAGVVLRDPGRVPAPRLPGATAHVDRRQPDGRGRPGLPLGDHRHQAGQVGHLMLLSFGVVLVLLVGGLEYFRRVERSFADVV